MNAGFYIRIFINKKQENILIIARNNDLSTQLIQSFKDTMTHKRQKGQKTHKHKEKHGSTLHITAH